ncbi:MAG: HAD family hydrolase [Thermodesulfobacteriota bacterium]
MLKKIINNRLPIFSLSIIYLLLFLNLNDSFAKTGPLQSWNDDGPKKQIIEFVETVTNPESKYFVEPEDRIATFDNDGNLWIEQPIYIQLAFAFDRIKSLAPQHPEWKTTQPYQAILEGNYKSLELKDIVEIISASHSGMTTDEFEVIVTEWFKTAKHPKYNRPYTELVYQPMLELLAYLRANGFKTFIVSGGGIEFMRPVTQKLYGIPAEQVIGTSTVTKYEIRDGKPVLVKMPEIFFVDDKEGKPVGIQKFIGKRPILASGNSDGDLQMLLWATSGDGKRLGLLLHHDDAKREYAYDRKSHIGKLDKALDIAHANNWVVISMKKNWKALFPFDN